MVLSMYKMALIRPTTQDIGMRVLNTRIARNIHLVFGSRCASSTAEGARLVPAAENAANLKQGGNFGWREANPGRKRKPVRITQAPESVRMVGWEDVDQPKNAKVLDVAVVGRPNAGKSSLVNRLCNAKVSAVTPKYNTTRRRVLGVRTEGEAQLYFHDTPGYVLESDKRQFVPELVSAAASAVPISEVALVVVDAAAKLTEVRREAFVGLVREAVKARSTVKLVLNKVDLVYPRAALLPMVDSLSKVIGTCARGYTSSEEEYLKVLGGVSPTCYMVSAKTGQGFQDLEDDLLASAQPGDWEFHSATCSDLSPLERVEECIREKLFLRLNNEVPYQIAQNNIGWTEMKDGALWIDQEIIVRHGGQKKMLTAHVKYLGRACEAELSQMLKRKVHLSLLFKVRKKQNITR